MSDFKSPIGFEDALAASPHHRLAHGRSPRGSGQGDLRAVLLHIISQAPQVMVKANGRTYSRGQLRTHLDYISRKGQLEMEDQHRSLILGRSDVRELADDWSLRALMERQRRADSPISHSVVLSMPSGTDPLRLKDAARSFAREAFREPSFDYVLVLHTDAPHPHIHLEINSRGEQGERLQSYPNLEAWRQSFAQALRDNGVEAEATPRWIRGVTRRAERTPVRKMREAYEAGEGPLPKVLLSVYQDAHKAVLNGEASPNHWERQIVERQSQVRSFFYAQIEQLNQSDDPADQALARQVAGFVQSMPNPDSQRLAIARQILAMDAPQPRQKQAMEMDLGKRRGRSLKIS